MIALDEHQHQCKCTGFESFHVFTYEPVREQENKLDCMEKKSRTNYESKMHTSKELHMSNRMA